MPPMPIRLKTVIRTTCTLIDNLLSEFENLLNIITSQKILISHLYPFRLNKP